MKCYGNVKGRKYYAEQPLADVKSGHKKCPHCKTWRRKKDFIDKSGFEYRICRACRKREELR